MSYNKILAKKVLGSIVKNGKTITLSTATETTHWKRPDVIADVMKEPFTKAVVEYTGPLPEDTNEICARSWVPTHSLSKADHNYREGEHPSEDPRDHFTGVCLNSQGVGKSVHFPVKK